MSARNAHRSAPAWAAAAGVALALALTGCAASAPNGDFVYAAPTGAGSACSRRQPCSLTGAQQRVRTLLKEAGPRPHAITVQLAGGVYHLDQPLQFTAADSGRKGEPVTWAAAPGAQPIISGGLRVTGWAETDRATGIWSATVPADIQTRDLYVDGKARPIASVRLAGLGLDLHDWNAAGFVTHGTTAAYFTRLAARIGPARVKALALVWSPMPPTDWEESACPIAAITPGHIQMAQPCWRNLTQRPATIWGAGNNNVNPYELKAGAAPTALTGALPLLTRPGQWYLDATTHTLYYKPVAGEAMVSADVELPRLQALLRITGTLAHPVHDLAFRGIRFTATTWRRPSTPAGFVQIQANLHITGAANQGECTFTAPAGSCPWGGFAQPPGAIALTAADRVTLEGDTFNDLGAIGVEVKYGSRDNLIEGNAFTQIASSAIWLGCAGDPDPRNTRLDPARAIIALCAAAPASVSEDAHLAGTAREIMTGNTVANNLIHHVGYRYLGAAAITLMFTQHTRIAHNDVFDTPYDGLTSGAWQGHPDNPTIGPTHSSDVTGNVNADNAIVDNVFHRNMQVFKGDGGSIYTEGHQGRTLRRADGSIDAAASFTHGLAIHGNLFTAPPARNTAYSIAPDVGSQWIDVRGNVEWGFKHSFSCHWPTDATSALHYTGNWRADSDDSHCATDTANESLPVRPGPRDVPLDILANAGVEPRFRALENALPPHVDYVGVSPATHQQPAQILLTGSGFTPTTTVTVGDIAATHPRFVSSNVLVVQVPAGVSPSARVSVQRP